MRIFSLFFDAPNGLNGYLFLGIYWCSDCLQLLCMLQDTVHTVLYLAAENMTKKYKT